MRAYPRKIICAICDGHQREDFNYSTIMPGVMSQVVSDVVMKEVKDSSLVRDAHGG